MTASVIRAHAARLPLPDASVDLIVTSPPYFGLRSYTDGGAHYPGQIGSEGTPGEWLDALLACTREWVRVLKPEGSLFVNLGDKYTGNAAQRPQTTLNAPQMRQVGQAYRGMPPKSLLGLPWRYAIGATDRLGLILRAEIVWAKPNGLPESVTDRVRRAHEQVFHFTRQPRYYSAVDEIRESYSPVTLYDKRWKRATEMHNPNRNDGGTAAMGEPNPLGKLPGSVWSIPSQPLQVPAHVGVDHFAAFPMELPRRLVLGWSPPGVCTGCGQGLRPVVDRKPMVVRPSERRLLAQSNGNASRTATGGTMVSAPEATIIGYACGCTPYTDHPGTGETTRRRDYNPGPPGYNPQGTYGRKQAGEYQRVGPWREYHFERCVDLIRPALVIDPFGGTGTTALVASVLGRDAISFDLSMDYTRLAEWRVNDPGERARAMEVPKPPKQVDGQDALFEVP